MTEYRITQGQWFLCFTTEKFIVCKGCADGSIAIQTMHTVIIFETETAMNNFIAENNLREYEMV